MSLIQQELGPQHIDKSYGSDSELFKHRTMAEDNTVNTRETENTSINFESQISQVYLIHSILIMIICVIVYK